MGKSKPNCMPVALSATAMQRCFKAETAAFFRSRPGRGWLLHG